MEIEEKQPERQEESQKAVLKLHSLRLDSAVSNQKPKSVA